MYTWANILEFSRPERYILRHLHLCQRAHWRIGNPAHDVLREENLLDRSVTN
jgi:hypothetical protein